MRLAELKSMIKDKTKPLITGVKSLALYILEGIQRLLNWLFNSTLTFLLIIVAIPFLFGTFSLVTRIPTDPKIIDGLNILIGLTVLISITFARLAFAYNTTAAVNDKMKKVGSLFTVASISFALFLILLVPFAFRVLPLEPSENLLYWIAIIYFVFTMYFGFRGITFLLEGIIKAWLALASEKFLDEDREKFSEF